MSTTLFFAFLLHNTVFPSPPPGLLQLSDDELAEEGDAPGEAADEAPQEEVLVPEPEPEPLPVVTAEPEPEPTNTQGGDDEELAEQLALRRDLRIPHIIAGNAFFGSMTGTFLFGWLHFNDLYGWSGNPADTGCARHDTIVGEDFCSDESFALPHFIGSITATTAYTTAFILSLFMPDPLGLADAGGDRATWLSIHRVMRWGVLGLLVAQMTLGFVTAIVETGNFADQRALATAHLVLGNVTYAASWALGLTGWLLAWG
ncbi:MAG: hypothetical protein AB7S26_42915 [Sandaracinaceae bacterium]